MLDDPEDIPVGIGEHRGDPHEILCRFLLKLYPSGLHFLEGLSAIIDMNGDRRVAPGSPFVRPTPWVGGPELPESQFHILPLGADTDVPVAARNVMVVLLLEPDLACVVLQRFFLVSYCYGDSRNSCVHPFVKSGWEYNIIDAQERVLSAFDIVLREETHPWRRPVRSS